MLAAPVWAGTQIEVPSGQSVEFFERLDEPGAGLVRLRFIAPDIASPLTRPAFDMITADLEALCNDFGLRGLLKEQSEPARIIVSLSAQQVEFGVVAPEVEQVFEAFAVESGRCILEMF